MVMEVNVEVAHLPNHALQSDNTLLLIAMIQTKGVVGAKCHGG
jgi:hypothetical protein